MYRQLYLNSTPHSCYRLHSELTRGAKARNFRSLTYEGDILPFLESFRDWEQQLFDPGYLLESEALDRHLPDSNSSERARRAYKRGRTKLRKKPRHHCPRFQLMSCILVALWVR